MNRLKKNIIFLCCFLFAGCTALSVKHQQAEKDPVKMVLISEAEYQMGSAVADPDEQPVHKVKVNAFYIDIHEVTIYQYDKFLKESGFPKPDFWQPKLDKANDPVIGITWHEAAAYAAWAGKRLPTEAEWECAARGIKKDNIFPWGNTPDIAKGNYSSFGIMQVMSFEPDETGLYDMAGNVWEWCADWYKKDYYSQSPGSNPKGPPIGTHKALRGGAWYCTHKQIRCMNRYYAMPSSRSFNVGFRCVRTADNLN